MMKTYRVVGVDNQGTPPLEVQAASRAVACKRAAVALVKDHCARKGLPYYSALLFDVGRARVEGGYQALRYIAGGSRDAQGKRTRWGAVPDPEADPIREGWGHEVLCGGVWVLEEV